MQVRRRNDKLSGRGAAGQSVGTAITRSTIRLFAGARSRAGHLQDRELCGRHVAVAVEREVAEDAVPFARVLPLGEHAGAGAVERAIAASTVSVAWAASSTPTSSAL